MYNGLTTADKGALMDAKARGAEWIAADLDEIIWAYHEKPHKLAGLNRWYSDGWGFAIGLANKQNFSFSDAEPVNIDLALAQIAEMGSAEKPAAVIPVSEKPLTMNERINQMTVEEKAREFFYNNASDHCFKGTPLENKPHYISINGEYCASSDEAIQAGINWLNSPYTEEGGHR